LKLLRQLVVIAGGEGTRLASAGIMTPKLLLKVGGRSVLEYLLQMAEQSKIEEIVFLLGKNALDLKMQLEQIKKSYDFSFVYVIEEVPLGTGGALLNALEFLDDEFLLFFGDLFCNFDLQHYINVFSELRHFELIALTRTSDHPQDSTLLGLDEERRISSIWQKNVVKPKFVRNRSATGVFFIRKTFLISLGVYFPNNSFVDLEGDLMARGLEHRKTMGTLPLNGVVYDIGTPTRLAHANEKMASDIGSVASRIIFLDRDGVIIEENGYCKSLDTVFPIDSTLKGLKKLGDLGYKFIVVTNQPIVARGEISVHELEQIHGKIDWLLEKEGIRILEYYVCPHHPESGFHGERPELKINCECRKPSPGLLKQACFELGIDPSDSIFIGDTWRDAEAAQAFGIPYFMLKLGAKDRTTMEHLADMIESHA